MRAIHQIVAGFANGDAISNEAKELRRIFRSWGFASDIYSETRRILPELRSESKDLAEHKNDFTPDDILFLHLSVGSTLNDIFPTLPGKKVILYHNITPPHYFNILQEQVASLLAQGLRQTKALANTADIVLADSHFNASELRGMGYTRDIQVLPLVLDFGKIRSKPNRGILKKYNDGLTNILFVGRCAPNKRIEDLLNVFYYFQNYVAPASRLIHVGSYAGMEQYHALLLTRQRDLRLRNVDMPGSVTQDELNAYYASAHIFLCMSGHEGFCIPLLEAMTHQLPVLAYGAAAVPETMDGAGILFNEKQFDTIAETIGRVVKDEPLRRAIIDGQNARLRRYESLDLEAALKTHLRPLL